MLGFLTFGSSLLTTESALILIVLGFFIGVFSVIVGGGMFFSTPLFQILFPTLSFGTIVGNQKVGSFVRGFGSTWATRHDIQWRDCILYSVPIFIGTVFGASIITNLSQVWVLPALIVAIILSELSQKLADKITPNMFYGASLLTGLYSGFLGAGIGVLLVALFRLKHPDDTKIAHVKIQARAIEWLTGIVAVITHFIHGNLIFAIWILWSAGSLAGGIAGGKILKRIEYLPGSTQKTILRLSFAFALSVALWTAIA